jgi:hypothetical protein
LGNWDVKLFFNPHSKNCRDRINSVKVKNIKPEIIAIVNLCEAWLGHKWGAIAADADNSLK